MKKLISVLVGIGVFLLIIFMVDGAIVDYVANAIPKSASEWLPLIRIGLWIIVICLTFSITLVISTIVGVIVNAILEVALRKKSTNHFRQPQKSQFQQRLEQMAKDKKKV